MQKFKASVAAAVTAALLLGSINLDTARAGEVIRAASPAKPAATTDNSGTWDLSARSRHRRYRNDAAVAAAVIGLFGTIAALAAAERHRDRYYYGSPYVGPRYYGPGPRHRHWRHRHHRHHWR